MSFSKSAEWYDAIYGSFKDYDAEAAAIAGLVRRHGPDARRLLDVACGTGAHARWWTTNDDFSVTGVDIDPRLLAIARARSPRARFVEGDMRAFSLGETFDAVVCLFSSIGYVRDETELVAALARFREHVVGDGVVVVEPWLTPEEFRPGFHTQHEGERDGVRVVRFGETYRDGSRSTIRFRYEIEGAEEAIEETHHMTLFTIDEMLAAFGAARLRATHDAGGPMGRGLYVALPI